MAKKHSALSIKATLDRCEQCQVRKQALFKPISEEALEWTQRFRTCQYEVRPKQYLYRQGDVISEVFSLYDGWVLLSKALPNGGRSILRVALPGDLLGFQADSNTPINHSAQALTPTTLCAFARDDMGNMLAQHPELGMEIARINARDMAMCQEHMTGIGRKHAEERLAYFLIDLFTRVRHRDQHNGTTIPFPLTQEEIADSIGLTLVHVNRTLRKLRDKQLIGCENRTLTILDEEALAELGQFDLKQPRHSYI